MSWFDHQVENHQREQQGDDGEALENARDAFRKDFEVQVDKVVWPAFEGFVVEATEHDFPATVAREEDAQGRLRAVRIYLLGISGAEATPLALETCCYKIVLQMGARRVAHMMNFQNRSNPRVSNQYDFRGLDSLSAENVDAKLQQFLSLSLEYCKGQPKAQLG
ncbi:MAG: hypothetical protein AAF552_07955 [Pseudomonadota bacterium]